MILNIIYVLIILFLLIIAIQLKTRDQSKLFIICLLFVLIILILLVYNLFVKTTLLALFLIGYIIAIHYYGKKKYYDLILKELVFSSPKIREEINIVYVADFQHDYRQDVYNYKMANKVVELINKQKYDVLLLGGDYINYKTHLNDFSKTIAKISNQQQVFGVWGNHDYPFKKELNQIFQRTNVEMLTNENRIIKIKKQAINISGIDDLWTGQPNYQQIRKQIDSNLLHIHLLHNPDYFEQIKNEDIDLALAGHYHAGQVVLIPNIPIQRVVSKYIYGMFNTSNASMFVTSGCGGSFGRGRFGGFLRFNTQPEVVKIKFIPESNKEK